MTQFNAQNKHYEDAKYPLFLGEELGVIDTINVAYPKLEDLYQKQLAQLWNEFEVDLTQDSMDMLRVPKGTVALMVKTIMWQTVADSVAARSIVELLGRFTTNSELLNLLTLWSFFEVIHARTYSHIIKQTFAVPNDLLKELYEDANVLQRSDIIVEAFDSLADVDLSTHGKEGVKRKILMAIVALFALESIAFMGSFAVTFAITETGVFQGIGKLVKLICRDEVVHTQMGHAVLNILKKDPEWVHVFDDIKHDVKVLLDAIVEQEKQWADYVFSDERKVIGLNSLLLKEYTDYLATPVYNSFGIPYVNQVTTNPLPYMDTYVPSGKVQTANMEIQNDQYLVGRIMDDTSDLDLGDI